MKLNLQYILLPCLIVLASCNNKSEVNNSNNELVFPKGEKITNDNFTGTAYLQTLIAADSLNPTAVGNVTFEPGARSKWHSHPAGQILLAVDGVGYYQEKGQPKKILRKGDAVKCPPNVPHWHGASADTAFVQIAITGREKGETVWLEAVTDSVYNSSKK
jgi:quercetin dioxygenase-like cupin family protein